MVTLGRGEKTALIAIALLALVAVPTVYLTAIYRDPMYMRYYVDPASAIHITASGDITTPTFDTSASNIQRVGNTYTLTGNITNWLIIEKSNMVLEGNGFWVGGQNGLSIQGVSNVTVEDVTVKASLSYLYLQSVQNSTILRTNSQYNIHLFLSNGNLISDSSGSIDLDNSSNNTVQNCSLGSIELSGSNYNSILYSNCSYSGRSLSIDSSSHT
ncbi:MAG: hypothetical protein M1167_02800 [Chloroflexi bacterium]|nr:hypothetical protein [Chloroflexota bacterium]